MFQVAFVTACVCCCFIAAAQTATDSLRPLPKDSLHYQLNDRQGDRFTYHNRNPFYLSDTGIVKQNIQYDPKTKQYYIIEKVGNSYYRKPTYLTFDEFWKLQNQQAENDYFNERSKTLDWLNRRAKRPPMQVYNSLFDRIFGLDSAGLKVSIKPQGNVDLRLGYQGQNIKNPTLSERARKNGGFDFDMDANMNVMANIGNKLKLPISYNTLANFEFENQLKLDYKGKDDEILKSVEAGNISFQTKGSLMSSVQSLFGLKTQLQFGKLFITAALANERSQKQSITLQGGGLSQLINKHLDDYDENRNFLMAQYFRKNYNNAMKNLPIVSSQVQIQRIEVWVTNRTGATTQARNVVGFMDLGESQPYNPNIHSLTSQDLPQNNANDLYATLTRNPINRDPSYINSFLVANQFKPVDDYEKTFARQLSPNEYFFNPQVGFISLYQQLQPDEVLAVAYQYSYNGRVYQVGEFSQDVAVDSTKQGTQKVLFLKLLKATSQRVNLPIWQLMMKNVYSLDLSGVNREDFNLNVFYQEPSGGQKRYLPVSDTASPLITILRADRLNNRNDPYPDGKYDFVDSFTVLSQQGKVIFPVLEPFGRDLDSLAFNGQSQDEKNKYVYYQLYDSIKAIAQTYANLNRYVLYGTVKGSSNTDIYLGGFNIPPGSVIVTAGGQTLQENTDYTVDYNLGTLKIINQAIINSGVPVNVQFENNATFGIQQRSFIGLRADYIVNKKLSIGATMEKITERPYFTKMNYGEDPISNSMYGVDFNYRAELPGLTRLLDKLPFYTTNAVSNINAYGEAAMLKPGHPQQIGKGSNGLIYIDDFEGSTSNVDLRYPLVAWTLASTPQGTARFPEATLTNDLAYGKNRAKLAWYNIEPVLQDKNSPSNPIRRDLNALSDPRVRTVYTNELFPQRTTNITDVQSTTFDMAYYPTDPGPYNYETSPSEITGSGKLLNPQKRWGGIMRSLDQTDFVTSNVQFIEFWVQDPFIKNTASSGGKLVINLGNISEDILKDGRRFYENGLSTPTQPATVDTTVWGRTPVNPIQVTNAFSNDPADRPYQDVGFDGLTDDSEKVVRSQYLNQIATNFGTTSPLYQRASADPSNDDYVWYRDPRFDAANAGIQQRYKNFNNPQGNSPVATNASEFSPAATLYPDNEDLNRDNTLNETEEYYEYQVDLSPGMDVGLTKYITDKRLVRAKLANGAVSEENWYLFRVPIEDYTAKVGNIPDFKSIRFIRMYMTGFEDSVVLRFATMDLVRNQWRNFTYELDTVGAYTQLPTSSKTNFDVLAVNLEENSARYPVPYKIPPGIERVQALSNNGINLLQNEQSMSLRIQNLSDGDARAVFKTLNLDMRQYGKLSMFIHAESLASTGLDNLQDGQVNAVIRIGQDFLNNYYEVKIPLKITRWGASTPETIWPDANNLDFALQDLVSLKVRRNSSNAPVGTIYREVIDGKTFSILGNPNLGEVRGFLIGVENAKDGNTTSLSTEVWVNELRLSEIDEKGGYAALGRVDMQLADLGTLSVSANTYSTGWGGIEQRVNERARNSMVQYDAAMEIDAGRLLPKNSGITIPVYASINKTIMIPEYDPYDMDVKYKYKLNNSKNKDSVRKAALDQMTIKTLNFTNVRFAQPSAKPKLWSLSNFDFTYSFTQIQQSTPIIDKNDIKRHRGGFGYTYNSAAHYKEPFKRLIRNNSPWFALARDFNFNLNPSLLSFRADIDRQFGEYVPRIVNTYDSKVDRVDTTYDKYFRFDRYYNARWDLTRSLNLDFSAINNARVDEPLGRLNTKAKKDTVSHNFWKGGRNTLYQQKATISYNLPLSKLPLTDWITARYSYSTTYNWIGASLLQGALETLGNTLENSQQNNLNGEFDFTRLYTKSRWLNAVNTPASPKAENEDDNDNPKVQRTQDSSQRTRAQVIKGLKGRKKKVALRAWRRQKRETRKAMRQAKFNEPMEVSGLARTGGQLLTMVKRASVNYSENYYSRVPGYMDSTRFIGQNFNTMQPGLDYVFGKQPDTSWLNQKAREGVITKSDSFNLLFRQTYEQRLSITASLEPIPELNIDVNLDKSFTKDYSELFKDTTGSGLHFGHLNPYASGGFSVSYISFKTLFYKHRPNEISQTFINFETNRLAISKRLAGTNKYYNGDVTSDGFAKGYGRYSQDVLIPAFLAAYTGKSTDQVMLIKQQNTSIRQNPFSGLKALPNWRVTYTGLTKIPALASLFSSISITHGYSSTVSMNSFTSALNYYDPLHYGSPGFIDTLSGNFVPFFLVPNLTIQEQFSPLIGFDVTTTNQTNFSFQYIKSRQLSLSLVDYQLSEVNSTQFVLGASIRKKNVNLPFKLPGFKKLNPNVPTGNGLNQGNDLNFRLDFSIRDDAQSNTRLDQPTAYSTGGQKVISIQPSLDYVLNSRVNIQLYFDQQRTIPYISTSAPITNTRAGLMIRISLAQ